MKTRNASANISVSSLNYRVLAISEIVSLFFFLREFLASRRPTYTVSMIVAYRPAPANKKWKQITGEQERDKVAKTRFARYPEWSVHTASFDSKQSFQKLNCPSKIQRYFLNQTVKRRTGHSHPRTQDIEGKERGRKGESRSIKGTRTKTDKEQTAREGERDSEI